MADRMFVATRKGLFILTRATGGPPWSIVGREFPGDNVTICQPDRRDGYVYAALDHGHFGVKLHRSADQGATWQPCAVPAYPALPEGADEDRCPMSGIVIPGKLKLIWSIASGGSDEPGVLWCGTVPGGLFRSANRGETWELIRSLWDQPARKRWFGGGLDFPGVHSICVDPRDSRCVVAGVSCGGVWLTTDGGATWACRSRGMRAEYMPPEQANDPEIQDPHCVVQCSASPRVLWSQHHNGVFRSTDGCENWYEIKTMAPSSFGFAVTVHPHDGDTAWFVPAIKDEKRIPVDGQVVVARTRDGGESFDVLRTGLPQNDAYDLVFRHALDVDEAGEVLAFGSTTGSLWSSDDQGESWHTLATNLPPIHCVRLANSR